MYAPRRVFDWVFLEFRKLGVPMVSNKEDAALWILSVVACAGAGELADEGRLDREKNWQPRGVWTYDGGEVLLRFVMNLRFVRRSCSRIHVYA